MLRVVIVDDEPLAIRALRRLLAAHTDVTIAGTAEDLAGALATIRATKPDVVLLDIELGRGNGFDVLAGLDPAPRIIFVTAHARYALEAFAVAATDYLLKPVLPERLAASLARIPRPAPPPLTLRMPGRIVVAEPQEIVALAAEADFTRVHLAGQDSLLILRTLTQFEETLPRPPFERISRSMIVNLERVRHIASRGRDRAQLVLEGLEMPLPLGRVAALRLRGALGK